MRMANAATLIDIMSKMLESDKKHLIKIIRGYGDFNPYTRELFNQFIQDDWDYVCISDNEEFVKAWCEYHMVCDFTIKQLCDPFRDTPIWVGVTYHS